MMKKVISSMLALIMLLSLCACGSNVPAVHTDGGNTGSDAGQAVKYAEWVYSAVPGDLDSADPYGSTSARTEWLTNMTFDALVYNNAETGETEGELAYRWEANEDQTEWTFWLNENVYFHNGDHMTAEDVRFTYLYTANLDGAVNVVKTFAAGAYAEKVEVLDTYVIKFTLKQPRPDFPTYMEMKVYSKDAIETLGHTDGAVIGTGPYYFDKEKTVSGQIFTVSRNENYWRGTEAYKTKHIGFKVYGDWNAVIAGLQAKDIDFTTLQSAHYMTVKNDPSLEIEEKVGSTCYYVGFNYTSQNANMNDPEIRRAIAQCINKDDLIAIAWEGLAVKSVNFCAPISLGYTDVKGLEYDPEAGAATLQAKGVKELTIIYTSGAPAVASEVIQAALAKAGVRVTLRQIDTSNWASFKSAREGYDLLIDYVGSTGALLYNFERFLHRNGANNYFAYASDEYESLLDRVSAQNSWEDMVREFGMVQQWVADEVPLFPLVYTNMLLGRDVNVGGGYLGSGSNKCDWSTIYKIVT